MQALTTTSLPLKTFVMGESSCGGRTSSPKSVTSIQAVSPRTNLMMAAWSTPTALEPSTSSTSGVYAGIAAGIRRTGIALMTLLLKSTIRSYESQNEVSGLVRFRQRPKLWMIMLPICLGWIGKTLTSECPTTNRPYLEGTRSTTTM